MRRFAVARTVAAALALAACAEGGAPMAPDAPEFALGGPAPIYLVTFRGDVTDVRAVARELSRARGFAVRYVREHAARGFSAVIPDPVAAALRADPRVLMVERDGAVSLVRPIEAVGKPGGGGGGQATPWGITRVGGAGDGSGKTAWIIDTGIDLDHPDLNTSRACHRAFNGASPDDLNGHGTHVAGTIAAKNNTTGVVGVAANAFVCAVRVLGANGSGTWEQVVNGVDYVAQNGAPGDVANMSLSGAGSNSTLEAAVRDAAATGVRFTIAAGNSAAPAGSYTPARVDAANVYTISAIDRNDCMASWSNYGNPPVDFAAPGVGILSTYKGGGTKTLSGTSMAAPHVAGLLLLGAVHADGTATCDPDGNPDSIAHR
jgi:subtilisin family serine protease